MSRPCGTRFSEEQTHFFQTLNRLSTRSSYASLTTFTSEFSNSTHACAHMNEALDALVRLRGPRKSLRVDNGLEFVGHMLDQWAYLNEGEIVFSRPGKPDDKAYIEAFNARLRAECLKALWLLSLADARERIGDWRCRFNEYRPHTALGGLTSEAFANQSVRVTPPIALVRPE